MTATVLCLEPEVENCLAAAATRGFWNLENMLSRLLRSAAFWGQTRSKQSPGLSGKMDDLDATEGCLQCGDSRFV